VAYPDINPVKEMVDMLSATRSYEANVTVIQSVRDMKRAALDIIS
jgi:flagellar basal-body rod protein FlgC